jgi:two-component system response regulator HydG
MTRKIRLLVVDDEPDAVDIVREILKDCGYEVCTATSGKEARKLIEENFFDLLLLDERMKDTTGSKLLTESRERYPDIGAIFITAYGDLETAVRALHLGALDFLKKPVERDKLIAAVRQALDRSLLTRESRFMRHDVQSKATFKDIIGESPALKETLNLVKQVIPTSAAVLLQGESGTGKELVAQAIHSHGPRSGRRFIPVNSGAIPQSLIESTLFGHKKGAFTDAKENKQGYFEAADGGTIFLDEIGELTPDVQVRLLRVLQEKAIVRVGDVAEIPVDVRIIAATHKNLRAEVEAGRFRDDLFYRLSVITINMPPLRSRGEDIELLAIHLLDKHRKALGKQIERITPEALEKLRRYSWPGNVRELENVIQRAIILATGDAITPEFLLLDSDTSSAGALSDMLGLPFKEAQLRFEKLYFSNLLKRTAGNKTKAAELAGQHRTVLYGHLEKVGLLNSK